MAASTITHSNVWSKLRLVSIGGVALTILVSVAYWGGAAKLDLLFFVGVAVLSGLILIFGLLTWWLYLSPAPPGETGRVDSRSAMVRQGVGILAVVSGLLFVTGATWDEAWHRLYGVGATIDDFLWPPHKLLYGSMALSAVFAAGGMLLMARRQGDIRQRFRAEPLIGMLALASAFLAFSAPSDYLWHLIYGLDITGWSLPHILITSGAALVMLTTAAILLSQLPRREWRGLGQLRFQEVLAIIMIGASMMALTQAAATEWDGITVVGGPTAPATFWARPEWLYPVVILSVSVFFSAFALHATRRAGCATLAMLTALGLRALFLALTGIWGARTGTGLNAHLLMILPAMALDGWYAVRARQAESNATLVGGNLIAAAFFLVTGLPAISALMVYPRINISTVPAMAVFGFLMALWCGWVGARFGNWMGTLGRQTDTVEAVNPRVVWIGVGSLALFATVTVIYMLTAKPPTV